MTFWPLTNSDFPTDQNFHQCLDLYTELDLHRIMSGSHGAFATGLASQQGTLTLPDTWFRHPFWDLLVLQLLIPDSSNLPCLYSIFHLIYPLILSRFCFQCWDQSHPNLSCFRTLSFDSILLASSWIANPEHSDWNPSVVLDFINPIDKIRIIKSVALLMDILRYPYHALSNPPQHSKIHFVFIYGIRNPIK